MPAVATAWQRHQIYPSAARVAHQDHLICITPDQNPQLHITYENPIYLQVAHAAVALMDATVTAGGRPSTMLEGLFIAACLRIASANEGGYVASPDEAAALFGSNGAHTTCCATHLVAAMQTSCFVKNNCISVNQPPCSSRAACGRLCLKL